ncbi:ABC transporter permease [Streptomyces sp. 6N223]|uniref:ABC transporter permease n=1 Tax=Streptomyces sp. 6N223 TaxID=3457412 RepID=UPI003FD09C45
MTTTTATTKAPVASAPVGGNGGNALAGTGTLLRFAIRRDRIRLPAWIILLWLSTLSSISNFESTYPEASDRAELADTLGSPAMLAISGPERYLSDYNYGSMSAHQLIGFFAIFVGMMSIFTVVRHTRTEEETGRAELLRSNVVGRYAHLTAALTLAVIANLLLVVLMAGSLGSLGLEGMTTGGNWLFSAGLGAIGILFAGVAAVTVQITPFSRGSSGAAMAVVGTAYVLRAAGDAGSDVLAWLSPIGWTQRTYAYVDNRWWPLLLVLGMAVVAVAVAFALSGRRDVGAGLRPPRPGSPTASEALPRPLGFALRLQRGTLFGFGAGLFVFGMMYGSILGDAEEMIEDNEQLRETIAELGSGSVSESFGSALMSFLAIITSAFVVLAVLRARAEETGGRAEPVLATGLSRDRWVGSHLTMSLAGGTLVALLAGLGFGLAGALSASEGELFWKLTGSSLAYAPALWVTGAIALVLFGWLPRFAAAAWAIPAYSFFVVYLGTLIEMPDALANFSPFGHVPQVPAADMEWTPLVVMTAVAAALTWLGLAGFRRRDLDCK